MKRFGGWRDLMEAPADFVEKTILVIKAEIAVREAAEWDAKIEAQWREQGLR